MAIFMNGKFGKRAVATISASAIALGGLVAFSPAAAAQDVTTPSCAPAAGARELPQSNIVGAQVLTREGAPIEGAISNGQEVRVQLDWTAPGPIQAGDYIKANVPSDTFANGRYQVDSAQVVDSTGAVVGCTSLSNDGTVYIVFNEAAAGRTNVTGNVWFNNQVYLGEVTEKITKTVYFTASQSVTINIKPGDSAADWIFRKDAWPTYGDTIYNKARLMSWRIVFPAFDTPLTNAWIQDQGPAATDPDTLDDRNWVFDCSAIGNLKMYARTGAGAEEITNIPYTVNCDQELNSVKVDIPNVPANTTMVFSTLYGGPRDTSGPLGYNGTYNNVAEGGADQIQTVTTNETKQQVGGGGTIDNPPADPVTPEDPENPGTPDDPEVPTDPSTPGGGSLELPDNSSEGSLIGSAVLGSSGLLIPLIPLIPVLGSSVIPGSSTPGSTEPQPEPAPTPGDDESPAPQPEPEQPVEPARPSQPAPAPAPAAPKQPATPTDATPQRGTTLANTGVEEGTAAVALAALAMIAAGGALIGRRRVNN